MWSGVHGPAGRMHDHTARAPSDGRAKSPISGPRRRSRRRRASVGAGGGGCLRGHIAPSTPCSRVYGSRVDRAGHVLGGSGGRVLGWPRTAPRRGPLIPAPRLRTRWPRTARRRLRRFRPQVRGAGSRAWEFREPPDDSRNTANKPKAPARACTANKPLGYGKQASANKPLFYGK